MNNTVNNKIVGGGRFVLKDTGLYGIGVFANRNFKQGEVIKVFKGEVIDFDECIRRIHEGQEAQADSLQVGLEMDMDLDELSRSFNHSCDPNSVIGNFSSLIALISIKKGEEITFDYSATIGPNIPKSLWKMKCHCKASSCRKIIGNVLTLSPETLKKYSSVGGLQNYIIKELKLISRNGGMLPNYRKISI